VSDEAVSSGTFRAAYERVSDEQKQFEITWAVDEIEQDPSWRSGRLPTVPTGVASSTKIESDQPAFSCFIQSIRALLARHRSTQLCASEMNSASNGAASDKQRRRGWKKLREL
jgi:hypothetical protein